MTRILVCAFLLIIFIYGSACTPSDPPTSLSPPKADPEAKAQLEKIEKAKLEAARYELQLYEEQLEATKKEISIREEKAGTITKTGAILMGPSRDLLAKRDSLEEKVIQAKVKVRELEILLNEQHVHP